MNQFNILIPGKMNSVPWKMPIRLQRTRQQLLENLSTGSTGWETKLIFLLNYYKFIIFRSFLETAGATFEGTDNIVEISPLVSFAGEGLEDYDGKVIKTPFTLWSSPALRWTTVDGAFTIVLCQVLWRSLWMIYQLRTYVLFWYFLWF